MIIFRGIGDMKTNINCFLRKLFCFAVVITHMQSVPQNSTYFDNNTLNCDPIVKKSRKNWTIMIYIAADNDLFYFAWNNIRQLAQNAISQANIIVFLSEPGAHKKSQIYLIEKNKATL